MSEKLKSTRRRKKVVEEPEAVEVVIEEETVEENILSFSCPHLPFNHNKYLDFLRRVQEEKNCTKIICLGDLFDNHTISYHETDPDGYSAGEEFERASREAEKWVEAFPEMTICDSNHDGLPKRKMKTHGLPKVMLKDYNDIWNLPDSWVWVDDITINDVKYMHGMGKSGKYMHINWATENMQSTVTGHGHSNFGVGYMASKSRMIFGLGVGCGVDIDSFAMAYGANFGRRPVLGCGVVYGDGVRAEAIPMNLGVR